MALTRAQLLMGNGAQGTVLAGEVQGVKSGAGIAIAADGTITVDSQSIVGVMKLGQTAAEAAAAYNSYDFPNVTGTVGQQLTITAVGGGVTTLGWGDPDQIPWTAKGQLLVGTGVDTQALLNVGADGTFLIADSAQATGFSYVDSVLRTNTSPTTGAAVMPASTSANRPATPLAGFTRFNTDTGKLEVYGAGAWETVASTTTGSFVPQTSATGSADMPAGTTAERDGAPQAGYTRFNSDTGSLEFYTGTAWSTVAANTTGAFVAQSVPGAGTASAIIFPGTTAQRESAPAAGYMRYNTDTGSMEFYNGSAWSTVVSSVSGTFVTQTVPTTGTGSAAIPAGTTANRQTVPGPAAGYMRFNTTTGFMEFYDGSAWSTVISSATGTFVPQTVPTTGTASVVLPAGTTANRQSVPAPVTGYFRYNTDTSNVEWWTGALWLSAGTVSSVTVSGTNGIITTGSPITTSGTITVDFPVQSLPVLP